MHKRSQKGDLMSSHIRRLTIERFRGIESLTWYPIGGVNVILGGGDVGKTTILDGISLLLNPTNTYVLSDADYWRRDVDSEFVIEAVMSLPDVPAVNQQSSMNWPWEWDGENPILPSEGQEVHADPVYRLRVRGTSDLELAYEILQPDGSTENLSVALRRTIGIVRLAGDDRNDRDLRLVQGASLDRLLADKGLRSRLGQRLATEDATEHLKEDAQKALSELETRFAQRALPTNLGLGVTGGPGISLNALVGLTAQKDGSTLPLANWGAGTRRLAALAIADALQRGHPIIVVDEIEKGLEPYRQRSLIKDLRNRGAQAFVTTHSATAVSAALNAGLWFLDARGKIGRLPNEKIARHQKSDPDTFLARLAIICEGATEVGFATVLLKRGLGDFVEHGVWLTNGEGHESTVNLLEAMASGGLCFAGIVDNEGKWPEKWMRIKKNLGPLLLQWTTGCLERHIFPMFDPAVFEQLIEDPDETRTGMRLRSLAERLGLEKATFEAIKAAAGDQLSEIIIGAATGTVPEKFMTASKPEKKRFIAYASIWFKSLEGGRELAEKVFALGVWPKLKPEVLPFINACREIVELSPIKDLLS